MLFLFLLIMQSSAVCIHSNTFFDLERDLSAIKRAYIEQEQRGKGSAMAPEKISKKEHESKSKIIGYYPNWLLYGQPNRPQFTPKDIDGTVLTHINYAFAKPIPANELDKLSEHDLQKPETINKLLFDKWADIEHRTNWNTEKPYWGNFQELTELKAKYPHLKTFISIGGWTLSRDFSDIAATPERRKKFAQIAVNFAKKYHFDGIDIDWEFPGFAEHNGKPTDKKNFTQLLKELYQATQAAGLLLTFAAPASYEHYNNLELSEIHKYLDWLNLMTYDFHGPWGEKFTNHLAPVNQPKEGDPKFFLDQAVTDYLKAGIPADKLVLGMPLYGRSFAGTKSNTHGLYSTYTGPGGGTVEKGLYSWPDIKNNLLSKYQNFWDEHTQVPYLYNPKTHEFISYDNEKSLGIKADYAKKHKLGGAMVWQLENDQAIWDALAVIKKHLD